MDSLFFIYKTFFIGGVHVNMKSKSQKKIIFLTSLFIIILHFVKMNFYFDFWDYFICLCISIITWYDLKSENYHCLYLYFVLVSFMMTDAEQLWLIRPVVILGLPILIAFILKNKKY